MLWYVLPAPYSSGISNVAVCGPVSRAQSLIRQLPPHVNVPEPQIKISITAIVIPPTAASNRALSPFPRQATEILG